MIAGHSTRKFPAGSFPGLLLLCVFLFAASFIYPWSLTPLSHAQDSSTDSSEPATDKSEEAKPAEESAADGAVERPAAERPAVERPAAEEPKTAKSVVYGKIDGEINLAESAFVNRLVAEAKAQNADVLLLELNTFGGRVDAAVAIRDTLMDAPQETVVFINKRAISAGALISLACEHIAISRGGTMGAATPVSSNPGQEIPEAVQEKYLSYFRQEMRATAESRDRDGDIAEALVDRDKEIEGITEKGKLLTLTTRTALEYGMVDFEANSLDEVLAEIGASTAGMSPVNRSWSENMAAFLTSQAIASLLMLGMLVFGYLEYQTPGFGFFGAGAICCFVLLYFSHYLVNLAGHEELVLFALGLILVVVELFFFPGMAIFGTLGALSILGSLVLLLMAGDWSDFSLSNPFTQDAMEKVALSIVGSAVAMVAVARFVFIPTKGEGTRGGLLLQAELSRNEGYKSHKEDPAVDDWVGRRAKALTPLRPTGRALIGDRRCDVEAEGEWVAKGDWVKVVRRVEGRIVVQRVEGEELESGSAETDGSDSTDTPAMEDPTAASSAKDGGEGHG